MGMDVYSKDEVEYFRNSVWGWRPLATYVCEIAPGITSECKYWQSNDGDGLDEDSTQVLAAILEEKLDSGEVAAYARKYKEFQDSAPDEECWLCKGSGERHDKIIDGTCNACQGKGKLRPRSTHYPFSEENVRRFAEFLRKCEGRGGFVIW